MIPPPLAIAATPALAGAVWRWQAPHPGAVSDRYTLQFVDDRRVLVRADCNRGSGRYAIDPNGRLMLTPIALTKMGCPAGSLDTTFVRRLGEVDGYRLDDHTLQLTLRDGSSMTFRR